MTMKTEVMVAENLVLLFIFDQINASLLSIRDFFQKH